MKHDNLSKEHRAFLRKSRRKTGVVNAVRLGLLLLLLGLWELVTALNWADPFLVSSPSRIAKTIASLYREGTLFITSASPFRKRSSALLPPSS